MSLLGEILMQNQKCGSLMTNRQAKEPNWNPLLRYMA